MRVLSITPYYAPEGGGLERYAHAMNAYLARRGHDVEAVAFTRNAPAATTRDGVRIRLESPRLVAGNTPLEFGFAARLRKAVRKSRPDVMAIHTPVPYPAQWAAAVARREGVPYAVTYHAGKLRGSSPLLAAAAAAHRWTLERRMLAGAQALVAVGPYVRDHALRRHTARTTIVPPGVDHERFRPGAPCAGTTVLFVGPLDASYRWKGLDTLWQAFLRVRESVPDARLRLVGDGDRADEFRDLARPLGGAVQVLGRVPEDRLVRLYQQATVTVLPSLSDAESFGMVLAEANACGRPVVASDVGGIPDFVRDGDNGYLARPGDPHDLAARITTLLRDPDTADAMGRRGRERVVREHDWANLGARTEEVLVQACTRVSH